MLCHAWPKRLKRKLILVPNHCQTLVLGQRLKIVPKPFCLYFFSCHWSCFITRLQCQTPIRLLILSRGFTFYFLLYGSKIFFWFKKKTRNSWSKNLLVKFFNSKNFQVQKNYSQKMFSVSKFRKFCLVLFFLGNQIFKSPTQILGQKIVSSKNIWGLMFGVGGLGEG